jgi:hypothetical protein
MIIEFTIFGKPDDPDGNPVPKLKMTGKQHWTPKAKAYVAWKKHVTCAFYSGLEIGRLNKTINKLDIDAYVDKLAVVKPLVTLKQPVHMQLTISWKNHAHADPENVFGSIADSIFVQDKYLSGSFTFIPVPTGSGAVHVKITI